jgi:hypothetical protein
MADDRSRWRSASMMVIGSDKVVSQPPVISFNALQNASSRLTLILLPAMTIGRLMTDFMTCPHFPSMLST